MTLGTNRPEGADRPLQTTAGAVSSAGGRFRRGVFSVGGGSAIGVVVLFFEAVIVARVLPVEDMGVYVFFQVLLALFVIAVDLGFRTTAAQFLSSEADPQRRQRLVNSLVTLRLMVVGAVSVLVLAAIPLLPGWVGMPALASLLIFMPLVLSLASLDELGTGMLQGFHLYRRIAVAQVVRSLLRLTFSALVLLVLGWGLTALVLSWLVSLAVSVALQLSALPTRHRLAVDWPLSRQALRFGMPLQATRYLWFAMERVNTFVLTAFTGPVGVAFFEVAHKLPQGFQRLSEAYYAVYHPSLAARFAQRDLASAGRLMDRSLRLFGFGTLCLAWAAVLFGRDLITLVFGGRYAAAAPAFTILLVAFSLGVVVNLMGYSLTASNRPGRSFQLNLARTAVNIVGCFVLIPALGFVGAAWASLLAQAVALPIAWWHLRRLSLPAFGLHHLRHGLLASIVLGVFIWQPPMTVGLRAVLLAALPLLALTMSVVTISDLALLAPRRLLGQSGLPAGPARQPAGGER
jgi:lipopolysaccharide exporter